MCWTRIWHDFGRVRYTMPYSSAAPSTLSSIVSRFARFVKAPANFFFFRSFCVGFCALIKLHGNSHFIIWWCAQPPHHPSSLCETKRNDFIFVVAKMENSKFLAFWRRWWRWTLDQFSNFRRCTAFTHSNWNSNSFHLAVTISSGCCCCWSNYNE